MKSAHIFDSFLDGFTGAGLFGRLRRTGAPTEFVDSRSVEEFKQNGERDFIEQAASVHER